MYTCLLSRFSRASFESLSPAVAMRTVSPINAVLTPKSAARAKSGRIVISGRSKLAVELMLESPLTPRS
ncbi:hypothetical protein D3C71_862240 [compost metagenome]